jgi:nucleotide-binding universal stress UspA family protein
MFIVVGFDRSRPAGAALRFALREARLRGATVRVVYAWQVTPYAASWGAAIPPGLPDQLATHRADTLAALRAEVRAIQEQEDALDVPLELETVEGPPAHMLVARSAGAELLVVGSRGRGGLTGLVLGSVSQACAHAATCPIVIVPAAQPRRGVSHAHALAGSHV